MYYLFRDQYRSLRDSLLEAPEVDVGEWHAMDVSGQPHLVTRELHAYFNTHIPRTIENAQIDFEPNLPWAENQFLERVGGIPYNPGETYKEWPWQSQMDRHVEPVFTHTYMERYWPKMAHREGVRDAQDQCLTPRYGIRYDYGDLTDMVLLLARSPFTRQAVLPVWFPEDTGGVHGGRLPCSIAYHFMLREGHLNCTYFIRSCDFVRHFRDDVYMTARLTQWVLDEAVAHAGANRDVWMSAKPGTLTFHCPSLHIMNGDVPKLTRERDRERATTARVSAK